MITIYYTYTSTAKVKEFETFCRAKYNNDNAYHSTCCADGIIMIAFDTQKVALWVDKMGETPKNQLAVKGKEKCLISLLGERENAIVMHDGTSFIVNGKKVNKCVNTFSFDEYVYTVAGETNEISLILVT